ncbi:hypothetical protein DFH08DRAFT_815186 [Mycena albidolilacea]|uniref:Uncharacterized protein n=1 Tax=Mycena albidolilacea TaxID=1033008 RepID=A0AAD6ZN98_9AGAR|nr:hypothetical protein DFH08DRAFT_815186 [Mycena albidolilacea]
MCSFSTPSTSVSQRNSHIGTIWVVVACLSVPVRCTMRHSPFSPAAPSRPYPLPPSLIDDQAEDSDEEAEEEHEGDEQEMKEDWDFVDDTAVHNDFVHRLPSNKDDAGEVQKWVAHFQNADKVVLCERDVAREAAGEAGTTREMLSPRELALYNRTKHLRTGLQISKFERQRHLEMLEDVDVKVHTWVHAPKAFDCRVRFVLTVTDLAVIQDRRSKVRKQPFPMSQRWFPRVDPTFADIALFADSPLSGLVQHTLAKPSPTLDTGDHVVVVTGESQGLVGTIECVRDIRIANERVSMLRVITPDNKSIDVGLAQLKCHGLDLYYNFRIHDRVRVVSGGLYVGATGRVEQIDGRFRTVAVPKNSEVVVPSRETKGFSQKGTQGFIAIPHKGFIGIIIGDFDSQERSDCLKKAALDSLACQAEEVNHGKQPHHKSRTGKLLNSEEPTYTHLRDPDVAGIMVTIQGDHSLETVHVPIEHIRHLRQVPFDLDMFFSPILRTMRPLVEARFFPSDVLYGMQEPEPPSNPRAVTYGGPFSSDTETGPAPPQSTTPTPANAAVWASQWQPLLEGLFTPLLGEDTGLWLCLPELAFKRLDMQVISIATLKSKKTSAIVRNCEGHTKKVDVCSIGKNGTMHPIDKSCVKPLRMDDEGHPLGETTQHVVVIGPDAEGSSSGPREYVQVVPLALHDYPSYVLINTDLFSNTPVWASRDRAISGNRAIQEQRQICPKRKDSSTPAHDWIDDYETKAASLRAEVSEAKAVTEGDPTNAAKSTAADYTERFGPSEPDTDVSSYIARRTRREYQMDELRHRAISDSCPFTNPGPLNAYYEAAAAFDRDFGHKYEATDEYEDRLSTKRKRRDIYKKILDLPEDRRTWLVGQQAFSTSLQNPFPEHDLHPVTFNNKYSFAPTLHRTMIHLVFRNPWYAEPLSIKCIRQYCKYTMWFEELEAMETEAQREARRRAPPPPIPTRTFYGAVDTALH